MTEIPLASHEADNETEPVELEAIETGSVASEAPEQPDPPLDTAEQEGLVDESSNPQPPPPRPQGASIPVRPGLRRDVSVPGVPGLPPQHAPPPVPPAPPADARLSTDSLSLSQLRQLVDNLPKVEPAPYAFTYDDASSFQEEMEEWFTYSVEEQAMLLKAYSSFSSEWSAFTGKTYEGGECDWENASEDKKKQFLRSLLGAIQQRDPTARLQKLEALVYIVLGCWYEKVDVPASTNGDEESTESKENIWSAPLDKSAWHSDLIRKNVWLLVECDGFATVVDSMKSACRRACGIDVEEQSSHEGKEAERRELWGAMTTVYAVLEVARIEEKEDDDLSIRAKVLSLEKPGLFIFLVELVERMRWDESISIPMTKVFLLAWKTILVTFGGLSEVDKAKESFRDKNLESEDARGQPIITASPLDYHVFRQEISSKYPAYNPPPNLFPLEPENNSILPPLKNHPNKVAGNHVFGSGLGDINGNTASIFQQPVHIATPAPSPPPSPAGPGGKGGKKQNYQTNQMFPFLYPPLDESSNNLGGKGSTDLQDILVGRKWEGSDIPTSILEAAELFSTRMRATRAMKQLWEERVQFMKYERGWSSADDNADVEALSLEPKEGDEMETHPPGSIEERLDLVEECYRTVLPHLQSLVIVMIKAILAHVTALVTQAQGTNGLQSGFQYQDHQNGQNGNGAHTNGVNGHDGTVPTNDEIDTLRTQEILDKSVCGLLMLMLKWFKISHILKFEYLTQLLVDSSYVPLILKLLQLQEIEKVVNSKCEQEELNFFAFCHSHSRLGQKEAEAKEQQEQEQAQHPKPSSSAASDSDDALPPPIRLQRSPSASTSTDHIPLSTTTSNSISVPPEVDELGNPTTDLPKDPITTFSWRAFFTSITVLRIMQKICKNKAHRNLMLVSYKSSQFLKKNLKVPQPLLRLYTLKLFKNQVPYCGRKWRQSNMRVITAVYLQCRPELRDDWLSGSDVDAEVDESVPLEQALRALTHWCNLKRYPEGMGAQTGVLNMEQDFFRRELEKMDWGVGQAGEEGLGLDGDADGRGWDVQIEGW